MVLETKINRRKFLVNLSQVAAGVGAAFFGIPRLLEGKTYSDSSQGSNHIYDCIVIGGGISGLTAARYLKTRSVLILESSDKLGGRIETDRTTFKRQVECGAEYVHVDPLLAPIWRDLYKYKMKIFTLNKNKGYIYHPKLKRTRAVITIMAMLRWNIVKALRIFNSLKYEGMKDISAEEFLMDGKQNDQLELDFRRMILSGHLGAPEDNLSMKGFGTDHIPEQLHTTKEYYIRKGYAALVENFAKDLKAKTNQKVKKITRVGDIFNVETDKGNIFSSKTVCYSASIGILKNGLIEFSPALPESKLAALAHLEMSHHMKIHLEFTTTFWPNKMSMLNRMDQGRKVGKTYFVPYSENSLVKPMLTALIMGRDAIKLYNRSEEQIVRDICSDLEDCFPNAGDVYSLLHRNEQGKPSMKIVNWHSNPHVRGGISYIKKDLTNRLNVADVRETYASSKETPGLFWAGEAAATFEQPASVHGAHSAGLRASLEIENYLAGKKIMSTREVAQAYHQKFGVKYQMDWYPGITRVPTDESDDENAWREKFSSLLK